MNASDVKAKAVQLGFDLCGIAPAADLPELGFLREWLDRGYGGTMTYLHRSARKRADVRRVVPSAQTVIVTGTLYNTDRPYSTECADRGRARIARYAWGDDYHEVIGQRMEALLAWMRAQSPEPFEARAYVDTGPVQERVYARHAGIGWIGKNSCVINPEIGSWIFLSAIICSLPLEVDAPSLDQCGTCTLCIEACPTQAIVAPGVLDATRCISYLTIELKSDIPASATAGSARMSTAATSARKSVRGTRGAAVRRPGLAAARRLGSRRSADAGASEPTTTSPPRCAGARCSAPRYGVCVAISPSR